MSFYALRFMLYIFLEGWLSGFEANNFASNGQLLLIFQSGEVAEPVQCANAH